ncbi:tetratricopeptide repeat protein [Novosphingobium profundi]|uniref:O-linked N-acetylglucosamine transferase, SPINDLY family protein n=1 Tax=Novosphingobium profundi TaxID=1774954 RepID=UPI001BDAEE4E|nr:tetratricopeptide repeat protein [Novosphingobium profundi]MBT0667902.1 tetratricopeptide repeat protein [Novosphingobium profundi]
MAGLESLLIKAKGAARRGDAAAARAIYHDVLQRHPNNTRARAALKALDEPTGTPAQLRFDALVAAYRDGDMARTAREGAELVRQFPHSHGVQNLYGAALLALGENPRAEAAFRAAIAADGNAHASYNNLAVALRRQGRDEDAEAIYREVIAQAPMYADARYNLANLLEQHGRDEEAGYYFAQAIAIDPNYVDAYYNLGNLNAKMERREDAIACYEWAIHLRPEHDDAINNMGGELLALDQVDAALVCFERALVANPLNTMALVNRGKALSLKGRHAEAVAAFRKAVALKPTDGSARLQALFEEAHVCDWSKRGEYALVAGAEVGAVQPFASLPFRDDPAHQLERSKGCAAKMFAPRPATLPSPEPASDGRIRLGYFSADFHNHATMYLVSGLFREHDASRFDVHLYSYGPQQEEDACRARLKTEVVHFTEIGAMADDDVLALARADNLDIAIDLKGFTRGTRSRLFGQRLAPVQVSYMGYPGTLGHPSIDYFIADAHALPPGGEAHFTEKIVRLAGSYQANDNTRAIVPDTLGRAGWNLPETGFVFASFNHTYKISPAEWDIWMRLLRGIEGSVLWLLRSNPWAEANLKAEAQARGVDPARLVFAPSVPHAEHLGRLALADLFLDTFAVNAHTTASDALWAGLPVLTLTGRQFAARVATSLLHAADLPELACASAADYEASALALARKPERLQELRARLAARRLHCPLFDTAAYVARFERALEAMHARHLAGEAPDHFEVD